MIIYTDITPNDWTTFVRFVGRNVSKSTGGRLSQGFMALGIGAGVGLVAFFTGINFHLPSLLMGAISSMLVFVAFLWVQMRRMIPAPDGYILGPREVMLSDEGLQEKARCHKSVFQWHGVRGIELTNQHVFVMVDNNAAIIVPIRAFSSASEREQFVGEIQKRIATAHEIKLTKS